MNTNSEEPVVHDTEYYRLAQIKTREGTVARFKRIEAALEDSRAMLECLVAEHQRAPQQNGQEHP